mmetsp:Transcript_5608/g.13047  ORF Transcript_5608/g.13047 Transcript_5608/m.13047 type:complete len:339 (-) Transcript_5608:3187-4203(-)
MAIPFWAFQIALLGSTYGLLTYLEKRAAMRGARGKPLNPAVDKSLRLLFYLVFVSGAWFAPRIVWLPLSVYGITFIDGSEQKCGRQPSEWMRKWRMWNAIKRYFPMKLVKKAEISSDKQVIFSVHPHAILPFAGLIQLGLDLNHKDSVLSPHREARGLAASFCFYVPIYRDILLGAGIVDASRFSARKCLDNKYSVFVVPGGATEALYTDDKTDTLVLRNRRGFIKLALEYGTPIVPVFSFGETEMFGQLPATSWIQKARVKFQKIFGFSLPLVSNIIPRKIPITTVVGEPMEVPKVENPPDAVVNEYLQKYIDHLTAFYNANKEEYNNVKDKKLVII